jgi:hypothetical protein
MNKYPIHITSSITEEKLQKGTFLFIYRATRIPPHIGIITNGLLYDITSVGPNIDLAVSNFYKTAVKRKTEVLFVELNLPEAETNKIISEKVNKHWKVTVSTSCLAPVKEFLFEVCKIDFEKATFLFDLLPVLETANLIDGVFELNLQKKIKNNVFELNKYTQQDIQNCILALSRKEKIS